MSYRTGKIFAIHVSGKRTVPRIYKKTDSSTKRGQSYARGQQAHKKGAQCYQPPGKCRLEPGAALHRAWLNQRPTIASVGRNVRVALRHGDLCHLEFPQTLGVAEKAVFQVRIFIGTHTVCSFHNPCRCPVMSSGRKTNLLERQLGHGRGQSSASALSSLSRGFSVEHDREEFQAWEHQPG